MLHKHIPLVRSLSSQIGFYASVVSLLSQCFHLLSLGKQLGRFLTEFQGNQLGFAALPFDGVISCTIQLHCAARVNCSRVTARWQIGRCVWANGGFVSPWCVFPNPIAAALPRSSLTRNKLDERLFSRAILRLLWRDIKSICARRSSFEPQALLISEGRQFAAVRKQDTPAIGRSGKRKKERLKSASTLTRL